tara:strand:+ start:3160 stop:3912 length:753 start_codon:yes stop_codon:yes gene_type:complete
MPTQIQLRRDTVSGWSSANTILAEGEIGIETDDLTSTSIPYKIGDGVNAWDNLPYQSTDLNGYLSKSTYDPQNIDGDAFDRSNHTGTQTAATISDFDTEVDNNTSVTANTSKRSYPSADETRLANTSGTNTGDQDLSSLQAKPSEGAFVDGDKTKLDGIEAGAEVNPTDNEIKTSYESNANTNAFTDAEKSKLSDQSGTNTGDQDISGISNNATAIQGKISISTVASSTEKGGLFFDYDSVTNTLTLKDQ